MKAIEGRERIEIKIEDLSNATKHYTKKVRCIAPGDVLTCKKVEKSILYDLKYIGRLVALKKHGSGNSYTSGRLKGFQNSIVILEFQNENKKRYPDLELCLDEIEEVHLVKSVSMMSPYHFTEDGIWGKENSINSLIEVLTLADENANKELISILQMNKTKPIKQIRDLWDVDYTITDEHAFAIKDGLFDIYYTDPKWGWQ